MNRVIAQEDQFGFGEAEKATVMQGMDAQVNSMADEIIKRVLPEGVTA